MTRHWNRNLITDRVVRPTLLSANGIYDLSSQQVYKSEDVWPYSGDGLTTDGLAVHLDAGDSSSYSGTGTTWYDLTSNNFNLTIYNGATHSTNEGGYFHFDGSNDYAQSSANGSNTTKLDLDPFAVEVWFSMDTAKVGGLACSPEAKNYAWSAQVNAVRRPAFTPPFLIYDVKLPLNTWHQYVFVREGTGANEAMHYINGYPQQAETYSTSLHTQAGLRVGRNRANAYFDGKISIVRVYKNKFLTREEVLGNFQYNRGRYSI